MIRKENIQKVNSSTPDFDLIEKHHPEVQFPLYDEDEAVTECCGANFYEPGYPDSDICTSCGEHSGPMLEE